MDTQSFSFFSNATIAGFIAPSSSGVDFISNIPSFFNRSIPILICLSTVSLCLTSIVGNLVFGTKKSSATVLSHIPGPWYASRTALHLRYLFARGTIGDFVTKKHAQYGDIIRLGPRQVWISHKDALKQILLKIDLPKVTMYAEIARDRNSPGLFGEIRPEPHKRLKKFLSPAFTVTSVDKLDSFFMNCTGVLLKNYYALTNQSTSSAGCIKTDLMRDLHCLALDIMGQSAFGKGFGQIDSIFNPSQILSEKDRAWANIPTNVFDGMADRYRFVFIKRALRKIGIFMEFDWPKAVTTAVGELINERAEAQDDEQAHDRIDLLQHMLDNGTRPDTGKRMTNQDIIDQMSELLLAGSETTSGTVACLFLELARNPRVRAKLLKSLPVLTPHSPVLDSKTVREGPHFRYLEACIKENLRMHPIASEMGRRTIEEGFVAGNYEIPPYTVVSASYRNLHWNERYWPEPHVFWPERWLTGEEREGAPLPDMDAYYPFSTGKHSCVGQHFAMAEIRTISANVLSRFDVAEYKYKPIQFRQFITMQFHDGKWDTILTPRWNREEI